MTLIGRFARKAFDTAADAAGTAAGVAVNTAKTVKDGVVSAAGTVGETTADAATGTAQGAYKVAVGTAQLPGKAFRLATSLATALADRAADLADLSTLLAIVELIPFIEKKTPTEEDIKNSVAVIQAGTLCCLITYNKKTRMDVEFSRTTADLSAEALKEKAPTEEFSSVILSRGEKDRPDMQMVMNTSNFRRHAHEISGEVLAAALTVGIARIPFVGGPVAALLNKPIQMIATFLIGFMDERVISPAAQKARDLVTGTTRTPEEQAVEKAIPLPPPSGPVA